MRVLDGTTMPGDACPDGIRRALERNHDETRMREHGCHDGAKRPEQEEIAGYQRRREWAMFGRRTEVAGAEHDRREIADVLGR